MLAALYSIAAQIVSKLSWPQPLSWLVYITQHNNSVITVCTNSKSFFKMAAQIINYRCRGSPPTNYMGNLKIYRQQISTTKQTRLCIRRLLFYFACKKSHLFYTPPKVIFLLISSVHAQFLTGPICRALAILHTFNNKQ